MPSTNNYFARRKFARTVCSTYGLDYIEDANCKIPHATQGSIVVPSYKLGFSKEDEVEWWKSLMHETYHHTAPEDFQFLKDNNISTKSLLGMMLNCVVDHKIERVNYGNFEGIDGWMDAGRRSQITKIMGNMKFRDDPELDMFGASIVFDTMIRDQWSNAFRGMDVYGDAPKEIQEKVDKWLADEGLAEAYLEAATPEECWDVAKRMVGDQGFDPEEEEAKAKAGGDGEGDEEGQGAGQGDGDREGDSEGSGAKADGQDGEEGERAEEDGLERKIKVMYGHDVLDDHDIDSRNSRTAIEINYDTYDEEGWPVPREPKVVDFDQNFHPSEYDGSGYTREIEGYTGGVVSKAVKKYLITLKRARWEGNKRAGKVSKKNVWKKKAFSGTPMSLNVHKKKADHHEVDAAVTILVDQSGSMSGSPFRNAIKAAVALNETFAHIGIPTEILTFTDGSYGGLLHHVIKGFGTKLTDDQVIRRMDVASDHMGCNADGESVMWAADRLLVRKEKKKVLIVLSDGQPAAYGSGDQRRLLKETVKNLEKVIDVHGIGIESHAVEEYYTSCDVIHDVEQLENALINVLKNRVVSS